ncbi:MAG: hypothetical protein ABI255_11435 [Microbacteriaceae bacterium]
MEIRNCPECGDETISAGLALWPGIDQPVAIVECIGLGADGSADGSACGWAGVDSESWVEVSSVEMVSAA